MKIERELKDKSKKLNVVKGWMVVFYSVGSILVYVGLLLIAIYLDKN